MRHLLTILTIASLTILMLYAMTTGIDRSIRNQDTMLCNSAKVSGNEQYLKKCQCFYQGQDISCLQEEVNQQ